MRTAYYCGVLNTRNTYFIDSVEISQKELAEKYNERALRLDEHGFSKFATTLRDIANSYNRPSSLG